MKCLIITVAVLALVSLQASAATFYKNPAPQDTNMPPHEAPPDPHILPDSESCGIPFKLHEEDIVIHSEDTCYVNCNDQMESCTCPVGYTTCKFMLIVEELQTFTSYKLVPEYDHLLQFNQKRVRTKGTMRSSAGDTYYISGEGYTPTLPPFFPRKPYRPPEYGDCYGTHFPNASCSTPVTVDGETFRMYIGINGKIPGPTLIVQENQTVQVRVWNKLTSEGISVHWHGLHQRRSPWMDGVGFVTQPPIVPGARFDYIFKAYPPGTHWYHSHTGAQRTDGLYGALVVMENTKPAILDEVIDQPEDYTLSLLDWQLESSLNLFVKIHSTLGFFQTIGQGRLPTQQDGLYLRTHSSDGIEVGPFPFWSGLINGKGRHTHDTFGILNVFNVEVGNSYRFRLIGAQNLFAFKFYIEGHRLDVIATDGWFIKTKTVDYIIIHTGERFDFILHANQKPDNYWIRAETLETDTTSSQPHVAEAVLHYEIMEVAAPNYTNKYSDVIRRERDCPGCGGCVAINCPFKAFPSEANTRCLHLDQLEALLPPPQETPLPKILTYPDNNLKFLNFGFEGEQSTSAINAINMKLPTTPYQTYCKQFEADQNRRDPEDSVCEHVDGSHQRCIHVEKIASNTKYEENLPEYPSVNFVLSAIGTNQNNNFSHPIHLHGHSFYVVAVEHGEYDADGKLTNSSSDITCDNLAQCENPRWAGPGGRMPRSLQRRIGFRSRIPEGSIRKDTVIVPAGGYVVIAFAADNPGYWFMHCHIESHQLEGMALIVQEYDAEEQWAPPDGVANSMIDSVDINKVGDFIWTVEQFQEFVGLGKMCSAEN